MDDVISRQATISVFAEWMQKEFGYLDLNRSERFINAIKLLPSTEKTGKWIRWKEQDKQDLANGNALYECSNCGHTDLQAEVLEVPYCWYCGARMKGKKECK